MLGDKAAALTAGLTWAGTFHAIGARILREHAPTIGLDPAFTIHDRSDAADLMNIVRHRLGLSRTESRFPEKATCLEIYSRAVNAGEPLETRAREQPFPGAPAGRPSCRGCSPPMSRPSRSRNVLDYDDLLLYWAELLADPVAAAAIGAALTMSSSTSIRTPTGCRRRSCWR